MKGISIFDQVIVAASFLLTFIIGLRFSTKSKLIEDYLIAPRSVGWIVLGLAAFAVNTSSGTLMTVAASSYSNGVIVLNYELSGILCCLIFAFIFGPIYYRNEIKTIPEYLERRFNAQTRVIFSSLTILTHIFTKISIYLFAGAVFFQQITDLDIYSLMLIIILVTGLYSLAGGQRSVIYSQMTQAVLILIAGIIVFVFVFKNIDSFSTIDKKLPQGTLNIFKSIENDPYLLLGLIPTLFIVGIWFHCADAEMAQKFLSGKTLQDSEASTVLLAYLKLSIIFIAVLPGILGIILFPNINSQIIYPLLINSFIPVGFKGIVIAGFIAALISSLSASFNACSTLYTFDIYKKIYPNAPPFILSNVGKIANIAIIVFSMNWVILIKFLHKDVFQFVTSSFSYMTPPVVAVFLSGIFSTKATPKAATTALISGGVISVIMIIIEVIAQTSKEVPPLISSIANFNFLYFTVIFFVFNVGLISIVTYFDTSKMNMDILPATFSVKQLNHQNASDLSFFSKTKMAGIIVTLIVVFIYIYLSTF